MADAQEFLKDFPLLKMKMNGKQIAYLDNGATTQKPEQIIKAICGYYGGCNANPHRGAYALSVKATEIYENARVRTAKFINAARPEEIIFTKNATEALNLVAYSYGLSNVKAGDEIVITITEHHSNLVPWQFVAKTTGATLKYIYLEKDGNLSEEDIETKITEKTKIVAVTQVSNVLGLKNDVKKIVKKAHSVGAVARLKGSGRSPGNGKPIHGRSHHRLIVKGFYARIDQRVGHFTGIERTACRSLRIKPFTGDHLHARLVSQYLDTEVASVLESRRIIEVVEIEPVATNRIKALSCAGR